MSDTRSLLEDKEKIKNALKHAVVTEWKDSEQANREFDFKTIYSLLCTCCQRYDIPLEDIRVDIGTSSLLMNLTLLHLMVKYWLVDLEVQRKVEKV